MNAYAWSTRADVLEDLKAATGGRTAVSDLDGFVVVGERPPPTRRESIDENEIQYHFGGLVSAASGVDGNMPPDLDGISQMLQLVHDIDHDDNEPTTIFRNTMTDKISISKLNPNVSEFVPSSCRQYKPQSQHKTLEKPNFKSPRKLDKTNQQSNKANNENAFLNENKISDTKQVKDNETENIPPHVFNGTINNSTINGLPKRKIEMVNSGSSSTNSLSKTTVSTSDISLDKKLDISKMKSQEIEEMKDKIKSKIVDSSKSDSIQHKKQKNVAIATFLRLCTASPVPDAVSKKKSSETDEIKEKIESELIDSSKAVKHKIQKNVSIADFLRLCPAPPGPNLPAESPVKLFTPDYFEASPGNAKSDVEVKKESPVKNTEPVKEELAKAAASTCSNPEVNHIDPFVEESIKKVNNWFDSGSPKPNNNAHNKVNLHLNLNLNSKPSPVLPPAPVQFKAAPSFKKKNTSSLTVNSPKSETSSEKKKQCATFVPSEHANKLLEKYEKNAKSKVPPKEDWRDKLERQLQEKDREIRNKKLEKKNAMSPSSGDAN